MKNVDIRELAKKRGVYLWEIAEELGISEFSFSRRLRHEFTQDQKNEVFEIIDNFTREDSK